MRIAPGALRGKETQASQRCFARLWGHEAQEHVWSSGERLPLVSDHPRRQREPINGLARR